MEVHPPSSPAPVFTSVAPHYRQDLPHALTRDERQETAGYGQSSGHVSPVGPAPDPTSVAHHHPQYAIIPAGNDDDAARLALARDPLDRKAAQQRKRRQLSKELISQTVLWLITDDFIIVKLGLHVPTPRSTSKSENLISQRVLGK